MDVSQIFTIYSEYDFGSFYEEYYVIPKGISFEEFINKYNQIVQSQKIENEKYKKQENEILASSRESVNYLKKYENKNTERKEILQKIKKHEENIDLCLKKLQKVLPKIKPIEKEKIIKSLGGTPLKDLIQNNVSEGEDQLLF